MTPQELLDLAKRNGHITWASGVRQRLMLDGAGNVLAIDIQTGQSSSVILAAEYQCMDATRVGQPLDRAALSPVFVPCSVATPMFIPGLGILPKKD